jgi:hypothetical protein
MTTIVFQKNFAHSIVTVMDDAGLTSGRTLGPQENRWLVQISTDKHHPFLPEGSIIFSLTGPRSSWQPKFHDEKRISRHLLLEYGDELVHDVVEHTFGGNFQCEVFTLVLRSFEGRVEYDLALLVDQELITHHNDR